MACSRAPESDPASAGIRRSRTSTMIAMAKTPSLKASMRVVLRSVPSPLGRVISSLSQPAAPRVGVPAERRPSKLHHRFEAHEVSRLRRAGVLDEASRREHRIDQFRAEPAGRFPPENHIGLGSDVPGPAAPRRAHEAAPNIIDAVAEAFPPIEDGRPLQ